MKQFLPSSTTLMRWLLAGLAETAVVIPWMLVLYAGERSSVWPQAVPGVWLPLAVYLVAGLWEAGTKREEPRTRLVAMAGGTLIAYLIAYQALPPGMRHGLFSWNTAMVFIPVAAYLWYQGASGSIVGIEYYRIFSRFGRQFAAQLVGLLLLLVAGEAGNPRVQLLLYWSIFLLFAAGLSLLLVTRERALQSAQASLGEQTTPSRTSPALVAVVGGLLLLTLAASYLLSVERMLGIFRLVAPLVDWIVQVAMLVVARWLMLFSPLLSRLQKLKPPMPQPGGGGEEEVLPGSEEDFVARESFDLTPYIKVGLAIASLVVLAIWLYRLNSRKRLEQEMEEERVSLGFWRSLWADLKDLFARPTGADGGATDEVDGLGGDPRNPRVLYRLLQAWGGQRARPRRTTETPNRYQDVLVEMRPESAEPAELVTALYNQARYGRTPPDTEAIEAARQALADLEKGPA